MKKNKALTAGLGYTVGNVLIKGINFLVLPIFSRLMTTDEFGVFNVFMSYDAILYIIVGFAIHSSMKSAHYEFKGKTDQYVSSVSLIYLQNMFILLILVNCMAGILSPLMGFKRIVLNMLVFYSFGSAIITLYNERISLDYAYKKYLIVAFMNSLCNVSFSLILIFTAFRNERDIGRILGATTAVFGLSIILICTLYAKARPRFNKKYWSFALKYSLPIVPHGISQILLSQFDRIMIRNIVSDSAAGIYSLAGNIKLILTIITTSISSAWSTWFYSAIDQGKTHDIQKSATQLTALFTIFSVGLMAISPELIFVLGGSEYDSGKYVAIPMIIDAFILFLYNVIVPSEYYYQKTTYIMGGTMMAAIINIVTNYIFINQYGFIAAAYTTLFSYICFLVLHIIISKRLIDFFVIPLKWIFVFSIIVLTCAAFDQFFIDLLLIRWIACAVIVIPIALVLLNSVKSKKMFNKLP